MTGQNFCHPTVHEAASFSMNAFSNKICLIRRENPDDPSSGIHVTPMTNFIGSQLFLFLRHVERREQVQLYRHFAFLPSSRGMTGKIFEAICQVRFRSKIHIELIPMVRLPDPPSKKRKHSEGSAGVRRAPRPQWYSSHSVLVDKELEKRCQEALRTKSYLNIHPLRAEEYTENDLPRKKIMPDVYYIPTKGNQVALDSFIVHQFLLYIIQFTGGQSHDIKDGLLPFLNRCTGLPPPENWRFIFIIPDDVAVLKCPVPHSVELQNLPLYSSIMVLEEERPVLEERHGLVKLIRGSILWWFYSC